MNLIELNRALHQLRLGGMVATLETRLQQAQTESMAPIDVSFVLFVLAHSHLHPNTSFADESPAIVQQIISLFAIHRGKIALL
jgi:hypothetical protein